MKPGWDIITGEYPPQLGGVSDYTRVVAEALAKAEVTVHVWCPETRRSGHPSAGVKIHRSFRRFSLSALMGLGRDLSQRPAPSRLLVQYTPNAFGYKGCNLWFCLWLLWRAKVRGDEVRVMFHEPYFYFARQSLARNGLALLHRLMAMILLLASSKVYMSIPAWEKLLRPFALGRRIKFVWLPIPSTIVSGPNPAASKALAQTWREKAGARWLIGHFGTYGDHVRGLLDPALRQILKDIPTAGFVALGQNSDKFVQQLAVEEPHLASRLVATGSLDSTDVADALRACDVIIQPFPDGASSRRTSLMAGLACGVATVTTSGWLTEPVWSQQSAVSLVPQGDSVALSAAVQRFLNDDELRQRSAAGAAEFYQQNFSVKRTVEHLAA